MRCHREMYVSIVEVWDILLGSVLLKGKAKVKGRMDKGDLKVKGEVLEIREKVREVLTRREVTRIMVLRVKGILLKEEVKTREVKGDLPLGEQRVSIRECGIRTIREEVIREFAGSVGR